MSLHKPLVETTSAEIGKYVSHVIDTLLEDKETRQAIQQNITQSMLTYMDSEKALLSGWYPIRKFIVHDFLDMPYHLIITDKDNLLVQTPFAFISFVWNTYYSLFAQKILPLLPSPEELELQQKTILRQSDAFLNNKDTASNQPITILNNAEIHTHLKLVMQAFIQKHTDLIRNNSLDFEKVFNCFKIFYMIDQAYRYTNGQIAYAVAINSSQCLLVKSAFSAWDAIQKVFNIQQLLHEEIKNTLNIHMQLPNSHALNTDSEVDNNAEYNPLHP